jgi:hypothetical protein
MFKKLYYMLIRLIMGLATGEFPAAGPATTKRRRGDPLRGAGRSGPGVERRWEGKDRPDGGAVEAGDQGWSVQDRIRCLPMPSRRQPSPHSGPESPGAIAPASCPCAA